MSRAQAKQNIVAEAQAEAFADKGPNQGPNPRPSTGPPNNPPVAPGTDGGDKPPVTLEQLVDTTDLEAAATELAMFLRDRNSERVTRLVIISMMIAAFSESAFNVHKRSMPSDIVSAPIFAFKEKTAAIAGALGCALLSDGSRVLSDKLLPIRDRWQDSNLGFTNYKTVGSLATPREHARLTMGMKLAAAHAPIKSLEALQDAILETCPTFLSKEKVKAVIAAEVFFGSLKSTISLMMPDFFSEELYSTLMAWRRGIVFVILCMIIMMSMFMTFLPGSTTGGFEAVVISVFWMLQLFGLGLFGTPLKTAIYTSIMVLLWGAYVSYKMYCAVIEESRTDETSQIIALAARMKEDYTAHHPRYVSAYGDSELSQASASLETGTATAKITDVREHANEVLRAAERPRNQAFATSHRQRRSGSRSAGRTDWAHY